MKNLYVGNLSHSTTEPELRAAFQAHGEVEKVSIVTDRETGRARGFAFVEMTNAGEADKAVAALNGVDLGGRALTINEAKPKTERPRGGGRAAGVAAVDAIVAEAATTIVAMSGSRASHAGRILGSQYAGGSASPVNCCIDP
jgi:cold-inducible RNA-binding protein